MVFRAFLSFQVWSAEASVMTCLPLETIQVDELEGYLGICEQDPHSLAGHNLGSLAW